MLTNKSIQFSVITLSPNHLTLSVKVITIFWSCSIVCSAQSNMSLTLLPENAGWCGLTKRRAWNLF